MTRTYRDVRTLPEWKPVKPDHLNVERYEVSWEGLKQAVEYSARKYSSNGGWGGRDLWYGNDTAHELLQKMDGGDDDLTGKAESMFAKALETILPMTEGLSPTLDTNVVGFTPNVGAYLAGEPLNMWRMEQAPAPGMIRLVVDLVCWSETTLETKLKLGTAAAAFAYAIQTIRPLELWVVCSSQSWTKDNLKQPDGSTKRFGRTMTTYHKVNTKPLDVSRLALVMAHPGVSRRLYGITQHHEDHSERVYASYPAYSDRTVAEQMNMEFGEDDIIIPGIRPGDCAAIDKDPLKWMMDIAEDKAKQRAAKKSRGNKSKVEQA